MQFPVRGGGSNSHPSRRAISDAVTAATAAATAAAPSVTWSVRIRAVRRGRMSWGVAWRGGPWWVVARRGGLVGWVERRQLNLSGSGVRWAVYIFHLQADRLSVLSDFKSRATAQLASAWCLV